MNKRAAHLLGTYSKVHGFCLEVALWEQITSSQIEYWFFAEALSFAQLSKAVKHSSKKPE